MAFRRTKILATLGPASREPAKLKALLAAGMDACRLNFSHGDRATHEETVRGVRKAAMDAGKAIPIVQDLAGPKIRVGELPEPVHLKPGDEVVLRAGALKATRGTLPVAYEHLAKDAKPGARILLDDGMLELHVDSVKGADVTCKVVHGGLLKSHKGINLPGSALTAESVTKKDLADLKFGAELEVDYVAVSFVRGPEELKQVRTQMWHHGLLTPVIAKIERPEALKNLDAVLAAADMILVARGDLGVELPSEEVPVVQKRLLRACSERGIPAITATQMLESMVDHPRPTRAEAADVANAILDGTGAVMLSEETAVGQFPVEAVDTMRRIIERTEKARFEEGDFGSRKRALADRTIPDAIARATAQTAEDVGAKAIVAFTNSGTTARMVSKYRPTVRILGATPVERTARQLNLLWGVMPVIVPLVEREEALLDAARKAAIDAGLAAAGDALVVTSGDPGVSGTTSRLRVVRV